VTARPTKRGTTLSTRHVALALASLLGLSLALPPGLSAAQLPPSPGNHSAPRTWHLKVVPVSDLSTKDGFVAVNDDLNASGRKVGSDVTTCRGTGAQPQRARCDVALALGGGLIELTFTMRSGDSTANGVVTGGTGAFSGARGTVQIHETGGSHADVTLTLDN
jgi:hypothetical protein